MRFQTGEAENGFESSFAALFGRRAAAWDYIMLFSMRLDETGTDGDSDYVTVGGAVATIPQWNGLEAAWSAKTDPRGIGCFHLVDFDQRQGDFEGWGDLKCRLFEKSLWRIIKENTVFRCAVSINRESHASIKKRMQRVKGFSPDSDYSIGLRWLMIAVGDQLLANDPDFRLSVLVEDGPWVAGAMKVYQKVALMRGKWKPARHAHRLAGFGSLPKGAIKSLDAADFIVGREHDRLVAGRRAQRRDMVLSVVLSPDQLESWYELMIQEKEARRAFGFNPKAPTKKD